MAVWMVRCGKRGEGGETLALEKGVVGIGWGELGDLTGLASLDEVRERVAASYPNEKPGTLENWSRQVNTFLNWIKPEEIVALPLKESPSVAFGRVTGEYRYDATAPPPLMHQRSVEWVREDVPRHNIQQDLLYSLGAFLTVCRISRNNSEQRVLEILRSGLDSGPGNGHVEDVVEDSKSGFSDIGQLGRDQIEILIGNRFKGHDLARLVGEILKCDGFVVDVSPAGPDGGVDILAGEGRMGLEGTRLAVQVKSGATVCDAPTLRQLQGVMSNFGATHGLLVSWGGFTKAAKVESRRLFFQVRLWDSGDVIDRVQSLYESFPPELRAEIPIRRIWTVAVESD
ncbi:restriction endonuclease [Pseudonocardia acaciae]|uniref:restriction endonuclease n=1 Tax=Pseudonocardia acaciae TaxID=551276 RepID=UPI00048B18A0|nr:restriction endonuclease [Pseudonocardia acaciae]